MSGRHKTDGVTGGNRRQSSIPDRPGTGVGQHNLRAGGIIVRGVVTTTYVPLDGPEAMPSSLVKNPTAVFCDVLVYSTMAGWRNGPLARVPVMQGMGMHSGHVWLPRATTVNMAGFAVGKATTDPQDLDGDHVLIQFLEDDLSRPIITGLAPHPHVGRSNEGLDSVGHRMKLKVADGNPDFWKHHGTYYGVDKDGNFIIDTTRANKGVINTEGAETPADVDSSGNVTVRMNAKTTLTVIGVDPAGNGEKFSLTLKDNELLLRLVDGESLKVEGKDGAAIATIGDGAAHAVNFEKLNAWWETMKAQLALFDVHIHASAMGPTGPPVPVIAATSIAANAKSTHLLIPDE